MFLRTSRSTTRTAGLFTLSLAVSTAVGGLAITPATAAEFEPVVIATGLDNPRQLTTVQGGLLVAEAGRGAVDPADCVGEGENEFCVGDTGKVTRIELWRGSGPRERTVLAGLTSGAGPDGSFAGGSNGASQWGNDTYVAIGETPEISPGGVGKSASALRFTGGKLTRTSDLLAYELVANPDGQTQFDANNQLLDTLSNPYAVLGREDGVLVADAGANAILKVGQGGKVSTFAALPLVTTGDCAEAPNNTPDGSTGCDPVPTGIATGPNRHVYVSGLAGEAPGAGVVWEFAPYSGKLLRTISGFTGPTGVAVDAKGTVWVTELFAGAGPETPPDEIGQVTSVTKAGARDSYQVPLPGGITTWNGGVYVTAFSVAPSTGAFGNPAWGGQIWKIA